MNEYFNNHNSQREFNWLQPTDFITFAELKIHILSIFQI